VYCGKPELEQNKYIFARMSNFLCNTERSYFFDLFLA